MLTISIKTLPCDVPRLGIRQYSFIGHPVIWSTSYSWGKRTAYINYRYCTGWDYEA